MATADHNLLSDFFVSEWAALDLPSQLLLTEGDGETIPFWHVISE
jgi:hypothetical protein